MKKNYFFQSIILSNFIKTFIKVFKMKICKLCKIETKIEKFFKWNDTCMKCIFLENKDHSKINRSDIDIENIKKDRLLRMVEINKKLKILSDMIDYIEIHHKNIYINDNLKLFLDYLHNEEDEDEEN